MWTFSTDRLTVRAWTENHSVPPDLPAILTLTALAPLPPPLHENSDEPRQWLTQRTREGWIGTIIRTTDGATIGLLLAGAGDEGAVHIGYLFAPQAWGAGYATELLRGLTRAAGPTPLFAGVAHDNPASARVLEKAGFHPVSDDGETGTYAHRPPTNEKDGPPS